MERSITCDDSCAQGCATYTQPDCALDPACTWFDDGACGPAPEGFIEGPICAPRRDAPCDTDDDCAPGQRCQPFWVAACQGEDCDACGGSAHYCVY
ncbi:MAG: hypothetical protein H6705_03220 [Myxococcales bacterium]|nr:hypothetical protein [Myxococcales bacterium]